MPEKPLGIRGLKSLSQVEITPLENRSSVSRTVEKQTLKPHMAVAQPDEWMVQIFGDQWNWLTPPVIWGVTCGTLVLWLISGPFLKFNDVWRTGVLLSMTTLTLFLLFIAQKTYTRDIQRLWARLDLLSVEQKTKKQ